MKPMKSLPRRVKIYKRLYNWGTGILGLIDLYALLHIELKFSVWWVVAIVTTVLGCWLFELWEKYLESINAGRMD